MPDREKVIKGLEICIDRVPGKYDCCDCPYEIDGNYCETNLSKDALSMLKEQEAIVPRRDANCVRMFRCGACGEYVGFIDSDPGDPNEQDNYCRNCGQKVKWND